MVKLTTFIRPDGTQKVLDLRKIIIPRNSNLLTSTHENGVIDTDNTVFAIESSSVPDRSMPKYTRKVKTSTGGFPYRQAKLVSNPDINKPWWIVFYVWDLTKERLIRKRVGKAELEVYGTKSERKQAAQKYIEDINYHLQHDHVVESEPEQLIPTMNFHGYSLCDAVEYAAKYKFEVEGISSGTKEAYMKTKRTIEGFLEFKKLPSNYRLRNLTLAFIHEFFTYLKTEKNLANKTFNQHRTMLHAAIKCLIDQSPKLFGGINPIRVVKMLKTKSKKHVAYSIEQMDLIKAEAKKLGDDQFILFVQFIFYTLARPKKEIRLLKVKDIRPELKRILFVSENAKTSEEYVGISKHFAEVITRSGILDYPPNHYVFSISGKPGTVPTGKNYFYKRLADILESTELNEVNEHFTLYGFKHTGAIQLYIATRDIKLLQRQLRHKTVQQTDQYLRDLGLFEDFDNLDKLNWK